MQDHRHQSPRSLHIRYPALGYSWPENHQRIFNEIGQLNTEHDRSYYGIGIGLYYAQLVTQQINGQLTIKSAVGEGSEFSLSLPITLANKPQIHSQHDNPLF